MVGIRDGVGVVQLFDPLADGRRVLDAAAVDAVEGVMPHHQGLEDQDGQAEVVVVGGAGDALQRAALQFGWGVFGGTDQAGEFLGGGDELEAVGIDEGHGGLVVYQHAAGVYVADDAAGEVHGGNGPGDVGGGVGQKAVVGRGEVLFAGSGCVDFVQGQAVAHRPHQKAGKEAVAAQHDGPGEGSQFGLGGQAGLNHGADFGLQPGTARILVQLDGEVAGGAGQKDFALATAPQALAQGEGMTVVGAQGARGRLATHGSTAMISVLSSSVRLLTAALFR